MVFENMDENDKFKAIFDNQDESVIIIKEEEQIIEYVNKKFYDQFEIPINQIIQDVQEYQPNNNTSRIHKAMLALKNMLGTNKEIS